MARVVYARPSSVQADPIESLHMTNFTEIKAVSFDVDGTLWDFEHMSRLSLEVALLELKHIDPLAAELLDVEKLTDLMDRIYNEHWGVVTDLNIIRCQSFIRGLEEISRPNEALGFHLFKIYKHHQPAGKVTFLDVQPTLESLGARCVIGLLSNGNSYARDLGLAGLINFDVFGQDHEGIEKPDSRMFQIALEKAGCTATEMVHVGDSLEADVAGAAAAGIKSIWVNRNRDATARRANANFEINTLLNLPNILFEDMSLL